MPRPSPRPRRSLPFAHRPGAVVAILGPDGAGKSTVVEGLRTRCPAPVTVLYLGRRPHGGAPGDGAPGAAPAAPTSRAPREWAFLLVRAVRHRRLLAQGYAAARRGNLVLCDRHPIEVLAIRPRRAPSAERLERLIAGHLMPWPDAVLLLDAPAEQMVERKPEHPIEVIEERRGAYREAFARRGAEVLRTDVAPDATLEHALAAVGAALGARRRR